MRTLAIGTIIAFALTGCSEGTKGSEGTTTGAVTTTTTTTPTTTTTTTGTTFSVTVSWNDDGYDPTDTDADGFPDINCDDSVDITIVDPLGMTAWNFGMAEDGATGWTGEDCFNGYAGYNICHDIGLTATLNEVTDCSLGSVTAGSTTLFDASKDPFTTYYVEDSAGACFVFGAAPAYYGTLGCTEMM